MSLSPCAISIPLMLGIILGVTVHPAAGIAVGLALLGWNLVQARRGKECTTCAWPRRED
ncbi:hypothetical protein [Raineyella fluvialis]|uniref:Uncharacterized protein n=1 Tax=Raineyella fluvialis TaxID=2662261 RepID=A0A5Q2F7G8_9ACTN|nr:hypothetical protein [Raineyella fluvialis]QGF22940.1 hypothetical protein Rai3103_03855 [Raineyella fluvialis]